MAPARIGSEGKLGLKPRGGGDTHAGSTPGTADAGRSCEWRFVALPVMNLVAWMTRSFEHGGVLDFPVDGATEAAPQNRDRTRVLSIVVNCIFGWLHDKSES